MKKMISLTIQRISLHVRSFDSINDNKHRYSDCVSESMKKDQVVCKFNRFHLRFLWWIAISVLYECQWPMQVLFHNMIWVAEPFQNPEFYANVFNKRKKRWNFSLLNTCLVDQNAKHLVFFYFSWKFEPVSWFQTIYF